MFQVSCLMSQYCQPLCFRSLRHKSMTMNHVSGIMSHVPSRYDHESMTMNHVSGIMSHVPSRYDHESCFRDHVAYSVFAMNFSPSIPKVVTKVCCRSSICFGKNRNCATFQQSMTHATSPGPCSCIRCLRFQGIVQCSRMIATLTVQICHQKVCEDHPL